MNRFSGSKEEEQGVWHTSRFATTPKCRTSSLNTRGNAQLCFAGEKAAVERKARDRSVLRIGVSRGKYSGPFMRQAACT